VRRKKQKKSVVLMFNIIIIDQNGTASNACYCWLVLCLKKGKGRRKSSIQQQSNEPLYSGHKKLSKTDQNRNRPWSEKPQPCNPTKKG
jgi:hypothetical protein